MVQYLCLHCLLHQTITYLPSTVDISFVYPCQKCGWVNDFQEDFSMIPETIIFTRAVLLDFPSQHSLTSQQCYPQVHKKDVSFLPEETQKAVIDYFEKEVPFRDYSEIYLQYLRGQINAKTLLQQLRPHYLGAIRIYRKKTDKIQRKKYSDLIYQHLKRLDINAYKEEIDKREAHIRVAQFFKNTRET